MPLVEEGGRAIGSGRKPAAGKGAPSGNRPLGSSAPKTAASPLPPQAARPPATPSFLRPTTPAFDMYAAGNARAELGRWSGQETVAGVPLTTLQAGLAREMPGLSTLRGEQQTQTIDQAKLNLAKAERELRAHSTGADNDRPHGEVQRMTWEQYNALPPRERAAVDFNTMLVRASRRDHKLQDDYDPNKQQKATYATAVEKMFGEDGGSELYAPETLAVLQQIHFKDDASDLDQFLGLKAAITANDLKHLDTKPIVQDEMLGGPIGQSTDPITSPNPVQLDRASLAQTLANNTEKMQLALAQGNQVLATMNQTALTIRNEDVGRFLGGIAKGPADVLGFGEPKTYPETGEPKDLNTYFQQMFDRAASGKQTPAQIKTGLDNDVAAGIISQSDRDAFQTYAKTRADNASRYDVPLLDGKKVKTPEEFRKQFGLNEGAGDGQASR